MPPAAPRPAVYCALDMGDIAAAEAMAKRLAPYVDGFKMGLELFYATGREGYEAIAKHNRPMFLDVKLHDIPNTVGHALVSLLSLQPPPAYVTLHAAAGAAAWRAARAVVDSRRAPTKLLAVTVLTSLDKDDLQVFAGERSPAQVAYELGTLARDNGAHGLVCSADEAAALRPLGLELVVPGIRLKEKAGDQKRVATPAEAKARGADVLVIGRELTAADDPVARARAIRATLETTLETS